MQPLVVDTSSDSDDEDIGIPPPPPLVPPRSYDHEVGGSSVAPSAAPPSIDLALAAILHHLTQLQAYLAAKQARQAAIQQKMCEWKLLMFQTIQDTLQHQLLADRAKHLTCMTHIHQHIGAPMPLFQSALPPSLHTSVVPAIQSGAQLHSFGLMPPPLQPITLDFSTQAARVMSIQPLVPLVCSTMSTLVVAVLVPAPALALAPSSQAHQLDPSSAPASESAPALASIADPRPKTDSDLVPDYALMIVHALMCLPLLLLSMISRLGRTFLVLDAKVGEMSYESQGELVERDIGFCCIICMLLFCAPKLNDMLS